MAVSAFPSDARQRRDVAEINITPLVDVLLVLLVIFMVTAPAVTGRLDLRLPQGAPPDNREPSPRIELRVQGNGMYVLDGRTLAARELPAGLAAIAQSKPAGILQISAAEDSDYQAFTHALAEAQRAGIGNIAMQ